MDKKEESIQPPTDESTTERRVLIVDDDFDFSESVGDILSLNAITYRTARNTQEALSLLETFDPHIALLDIRLGQDNGLSLIADIKKLRPNTICVMMTAYAHIDSAVKALQSGAYDYLRKPISGEELLIALDRAFERLRLEYAKERAEAELLDRNKMLQESNVRLRMIFESTRKITACTRLPEFGPLLLEEFARNMGALGGSFYVKKDDQLILLHTLDPGHSPHNLSLPLHEGTLFHRVFSGHKPLLIRDISIKKNMQKSGWEGYQNGSCIIFPIFDVHGGVVGVISLHNKINPPFTQQDLALGMLIASYTAESLHAVRATDNLSKSEERYRNLVETMNDGLVIVNKDGRITYVNHRFCGMLGVRESDVVNTFLLDLVSPESKETVTQIMPVHGKTALLVPSTEIRFVCAKETPCVTIVSPQRMNTAEGVFTGWFAVVTDITKRKHAEEALRKQKYESDVRVKELNCLFHIASMVDKPNTSLDDILSTTVMVLPQAFQYPEVSCVYINVGEHVYCQDSCTSKKQNCIGTCEVPTTWQLSRAIYSYGEKVGELTVWYREERQAADHGPFLKEEKSVVSAVADFLGSIIERKKADTELKHTVDKLQKAMEGVIQAMAMTAEMRDPYTAGHQRRVSALATAIAREMNLSAHEIEGIRLAALIHDLGKIYVPAEILSKPGKMSDIEFSIIKTHPQVGHDILKTIEFPWPLATIVHQHHERLDGSGYPLGLRDGHILLASRIVSVADTVEAMASHRPYRPSLGIDVALDEIRKNAGSHYDQHVVDVCLKLFLEKGFVFE